MKNIYIQYIGIFHIYIYIYIQSTPNIEIWHLNLQKHWILEFVQQIFMFIPCKDSKCVLQPWNKGIVGTKTSFYFSSKGFLLVYASGFLLLSTILWTNPSDIFDLITWQSIFLLYVLLFNIIWTLRIADWILPKLFFILKRFSWISYFLRLQTDSSLRETINWLP